MTEWGREVDFKMESNISEIFAAQILFIGSYLTFLKKETNVEDMQIYIIQFKRKIPLLDK